MANKGLYIPPEILGDSQLGSSQKMVYAAMVAAADRDGMVRLTSHELGNRVGMSEGAARENRVQLRRRGYIEHIDRTTVNFRILKWPGGDGDGGAYLSQRPGVRRDLQIHSIRNQSSDRDGGHRAATDSREHGADGNGHDEDCPV